MVTQETETFTSDTSLPVAESASPAVALDKSLPEVNAAMYLQGAIPAFRNKLENLTGVQAKHVLSALMEAPLEKETPAFTTALAQELYDMGTYITSAKFLLFKDENKVMDKLSKKEEKNELPASG